MWRKRRRDSGREVRELSGDRKEMRRDYFLKRSSKAWRALLVRGGGAAAAT